MKNHLLCFLFLLLGSMTALAQKRVSGNVTGSDGFPLIGVAILEAGTDNGTSSDIEGNYTLDISDGATLNFSYTGFASQSIVVGGQSILDVVLQEGLALDEVVVTALGIILFSNRSRWREFFCSSFYECDSISFWKSGWS
jgi:hypothetical protein